MSRSTGQFLTRQRDRASFRSEAPVSGRPCGLLLGSDSASEARRAQGWACVVDGAAGSIGAPRDRNQPALRPTPGCRGQDAFPQCHKEPSWESPRRPVPPMTALASAGEVACPARSARGDPRPRPSTDVTVITVSHCPSPGSAVHSLASILRASVSVLRGLRTARPLRLALTTEGPGRPSQKSD